MKKLLFLVLTAAILLPGIIKAGDGDEKNPGNRTSISNINRFLEDYKLAKKEFNYNTGKGLGFYIDFQLGVGATNPNITEASGSKSNYQTTSKPGYTVGAMIFLNIFDMLNFSSGLTFNGRSFQITTPTIPNDTTVKANQTSYIPGNYLDIPLNLNFGGMISERVGLWFNGGPYLGILLNTPAGSSTGLGYKNFDFGVNATLTGNYVFAYPLSAILGTTFKYGGLNNLGSTQSVEKITTSNFLLFTGLRLQF